MSISLMQFSCGDYSIEGEEIRKDPETDESVGVSMRRGMDLQKEEELELEFRPLDHPMEPPDEDRPVKCPIPHSSIINVDGRVHEKRVGESWRERGDKANREGTEAEAAAARGVRKRHHNLIRGEQILTPLPRTLPSSLLSNVEPF